jgi:hypothetical protein
LASRSHSQSTRDSTSEECEVVEIQVGELILTSFNPSKKQTGAVNGQRFEFDHSLWDSEAYFPFWGAKLRLSLSAGASRPQQHQLDGVQSILNHRTCIRSEVESAIFEYYRSRVYHEGAKDLDGKSLPNPADYKRIRKLLHGPTIHPESVREEGDPVSFTLHFGCDWDEEHGLGVTIENWKITYIGT